MQQEKRKVEDFLTLVILYSSMSQDKLYVYVCVYIRIATYDYTDFH